MNGPAFFVGFLGLLFVAAVVVLVLRWLDRRDVPYPHEISDGDD